MSFPRNSSSPPEDAAREVAARAHNEGIGLARAGDFPGAAARFARAVELAGADRVDPRTLKALWQAAIAASDWKTGIVAAIRAAARDPADSAFIHDAVQSLARCPLPALTGSAGYQWRPVPTTLPTLSVILVSRDDARFAAVDAQYARAFAGWPHERIRIRDARSMYDGYARGFARSTGDIIVFSHDDIRFAIPDFAARLADAMDDADIVGVAGTTRVCGPALPWAGHPDLFGTITQHGEAEPGFEFCAASLSGPRIAGAQGLDGVFIAGRRTWVERVGFDPQRFTGFHFYDLDFSYRAHLAGARVAIAADLGLIHRSRGVFDEQWLAAQQAFARKFSFAAAPPGAARHWYAVKLPDEPAVTAMYAKLFAAWSLAAG
jgi:hypothetical protein